MSRLVADGILVGIGVADGAESNTLVELDIVADYACGSDYDARAVVDGEAFSNLRLRVDVDACLAMGYFGYHPWNQGDPEFEELMCDAIARDGADGRVGEDDF